MRQTKSGFALKIGAVIIAILTIVGAAYTFKNAGTDKDLVASALKATGVAVDEESYGYDINPCPIDCLKLYLDYGIIKDKGTDALNEAKRICKKYGDDSKKCKKAQSESEELRERAIKALAAYYGCLLKHKSTRPGHCPKAYIVTEKESDQCQYYLINDMFTDFRDDLIYAISNYNKCMGSGKKDCSEQKKQMDIVAYSYDIKVGVSMQQCRPFQIEKYPPSSQEIINSFKK